ncbi:adhesion G protein-coupled receptor B2-like [Amphiura filiformis]|uniref:adhesion G protein-coupled receptor B2-like n=1 Tax=Amphiura filiformis TaxID=82378 RepID=UPI003B20B991
MGVKVLKLLFLAAICSRASTRTCTIERQTDTGSGFKMRWVLRGSHQTDPCSCIGFIFGGFNAVPLSKSDELYEFDNLNMFLEEFGCLADRPTWMEWGPWDPCSVQCGVSTQQRIRMCFHNGGLVANTFCNGDSTDIRDCNGTNCPTWMEWGSWDPCGVQCGVGTQQRIRMCFQNGGLVANTFCNGDSTDIRACNGTNCPFWGAWGNWSDCTNNCGEGEKTRSRICHGLIDGLTCTGETTELATCIKHNFCRSDSRCGSQYAAPDGEPARCFGGCCSNSGWCGATSNYCGSGSVDYMCCNGDVCTSPC